jgi:hypothetical protein
VAIRGRPARKAIHQRLAVEVEELHVRLGGLPKPEEAAAIWTDIWYHEAHNSTALEGNTLVLREVALLLGEGRAVGHKELKDYLEVAGYAQAARWVYGQAFNHDEWSSSELVTLTEVRQIHRLALTPVLDIAPHPDAFESERPGNWRRHDIRAFGAGMIPPDHTQIPALMTDWAADAGRIRDAPSPVAEAIAVRHAAFERIHPFLDGNGRVGRLVTNLILARLGYPPAIIQKRDRTRYLNALRHADQGDAGPLGELIARSVLDNLSRFVLPAVAGSARLVPLEALADAGFSTIALRSAAERSRLRAVKSTDGIWRSSRQWVEEYRASRYQTLRQPRGPAGSKASGEA